MESKLYPVFEVDCCFGTYAIEYRLIGANDFNDLKEHFDEIFGSMLTKPEIKKLKKAGIERIKKIDGLFTKEPYKIIETYAYYE